MRSFEGVRAAVLLLAVASLVASLAGRTFGYQGDQHTAVRSGHADPKHQKLERDLPAWSIPLAVFVPPLWSEVSSPVVAASEPLVPVDLDSCLYNRPPPFLSS